jgi:hypothetical protein
MRQRGLAHRPLAEQDNLGIDVAARDLHRRSEGAEDSNAVDEDCPVVRTHDEPGTVGAEGSGNRRMTFPLDHLQAVPRLPIPEPNREVLEPRGGDQRPVGREGDRIHSVLMTLQRPGAGSRSEVPDLYGLVFRARNGNPSIRRDQDGGHPIRMALQRRQAFARFEVPEPDRFVKRPGNGPFPVMRSRHGTHHAGMALQCCQALLARDIPNRRVASPACNHAAAVRQGDDRQDHTLPPLPTGHQLSIRGIPNTNGTVVRTRHNPLSIRQDRDGPNLVRVPLQRRPAFPGLQVPNLDRLVV